MANILHYEASIKGSLFIVTQTYADSQDDYQVLRQPINPKTGKGWQAKKTLHRFTGERSKAKAMAYWLKVQTEARK